MTDCFTLTITWVCDKQCFVCRACLKKTGAFLAEYVSESLTECIKKCMYECWTFRHQIYRDFKNCYPEKYIESDSGQRFVDFMYPLLIERSEFDSMGYILSLKEKIDVSF